ncbi:MAG TPA: cation transporter, partial [Phenylobacterium sp.]|nr:cation transporter [Phenylobacterium sp.]
MALTYDTVAGAGPDLSAFLKPREGGAKGIDLLVQGARCANCMAKIEKGVAALPDVEAARLNLTSGKLTVTFRTGAVANPGAVLTTVEGLGYSATPFDPGAAVEAHDREGRRLALAL